MYRYTTAARGRHGGMAKRSPLRHRAVEVARCRVLYAILTGARQDSGLVQNAPRRRSRLGGIGGKNLSEDFQKLEDKVALQNARSDARLDSADTSSGKALEDKLAALNKGPSVEDRLAALKKQLDTPAQ